MIQRELFIKQIKPINNGYKATTEWQIELLDVNQNYAIRLNRGVYGVFAIVSSGDGTTIDYFVGKRYQLADAKQAVYDHYQSNYEKYKRR